MGNVFSKKECRGSYFQSYANCVLGSYIQTLLPGKAANELIILSAWEDFSACNVHFKI